MSHRPFSLLPASALRDIELHGRVAMQRWALDWLPSNAQVPVVETRRASRQAADVASSGRMLGDAEGRFVWISDADRSVLACWLFPGARPADIATAGEVMSHVLDAAVDALLRLLQGDAAKTIEGQMPIQQELPARCCLPGMPVVDLRIAFGALSIGVIQMSGATAKPSAIKASLKPCEPVAKAMGQQLVTLRADLGQIEMDLQSLYGLVEGDVIRLQARLDAPVALLVDGASGPAPVKAYLGTIDAHRALEIVSAI
jgi:hypothetical protein